MRLFSNLQIPLRRFGAEAPPTEPRGSVRVVQVWFWFFLYMGVAFGAVQATILAGLALGSSGNIGAPEEYPIIAGPRPAYAGSISGAVIEKSNQNCDANNGSAVTVALNTDEQVGWALKLGAALSCQPPAPRVREERAGAQRRGVLANKMEQQERHRAADIKTIWCLAGH
ncbi:hypothetical protein EYF80_012466 [Liparis tanakae]|uniref:Uncharacterized protein n=1 Tax=Liparis tanakae TaxID=230148 RepID=A0A4Z2IJD1_9TELE|nr:hypothetical protein EYF80_012466 [Liparis tanakae]